MYAHYPNRMWQLCMNNIQLPGYSVSLLMKEREKRKEGRERKTNIKLSQFN